jgi:hypothetical protein
MNRWFTRVYFEERGYIAPLPDAKRVLPVRGGAGT